MSNVGSFSGMPARASSPAGQDITPHNIDAMTQQVSALLVKNANAYTAQGISVGGDANNVTTTDPTPAPSYLSSDTIAEMVESMMSKISQLRLTTSKSEIKAEKSKAAKMHQKNMARIKKKEAAAQKAKRSGLLAKIFGWIMVAVAAIATVLTAGSASPLLVGALAVGTVLTVLTQAGVMKKIITACGGSSKDAMWGSLGIGIAVSVAMMVLSFGASSAGGVSSLVSKVATLAGKGSTAAAEEGVEMASLGTSAATAAQDGGQAATVVEDAGQVAEEAETSFSTVAKDIDTDADSISDADSIGDEAASDEAASGAKENTEDAKASKDAEAGKDSAQTNQVASSVKNPSRFSRVIGKLAGANQVLGGSAAIGGGATAIETGSYTKDEMDEEAAIKRIKAHLLMINAVVDEDEKKLEEIVEQQASSFENAMSIISSTNVANKKIINNIISAHASA